MSEKPKVHPEDLKFVRWLATHGGMTLDEVIEAAQVLKLERDAEQGQTGLALHHQENVKCSI